MKLNPNCIRDILITVERYSDFHHQTEYKEEEPFDSLSAYSHEEIIYHIRQCEESELICDVHYYSGGTHTDIRDLSPKGHEFLANTRNDSVWKKPSLKELELLSLSSWNSQKKLRLSSSSAKGI